METLTVTVIAGLANRIRALVSTLAIGREMRIPTTIVWTPSAACQIAFDDLFVPLPNVQREPIAGRPMSCPTAAQFLRLPKSTHTHIVSYAQFYRSPQLPSILRELKPRPEYLEAVAALFGERCVVGVQIRRTDNTLAIQHSPTEAFLQAMAAYPASTHFFLATDSASEKTRLRDAYGDRLLTFDAPLNRDTAEGMKAGFIDFLALSRCTEILASYHSSFSEQAAEFGGIPRKVVRTGKC